MVLVLLLAALLAAGHGLLNAPPLGVLSILWHAPLPQARLGPALADQWVVIRPRMVCSKLAG